VIGRRIRVTRCRAVRPDQRRTLTGSPIQPHVGFGRLIGLALLAVLSAGCRPRSQHLTVPVSSWPGYEYLYLAAQQGLDTAQGFSLRTEEFADPQAIVHAYLQGELTIAPLTSVEAVDICSRAPGRCPVVVLVLDESRGGDQLLARPSIRSVSQLRGRRVAVSPSTLGSYVLSRALEREGLNLGDVQVLHMPLAEIPAALAAGRVDAAALFPPYSAEARQQAGAIRLFDSREIPGEIFDILVVDPKALERWGDALPKLLRAWQAAHSLRRRQPDLVILVMARREGLSPQAFREVEQGLVYFDLPQQRPLLAPDGPLARNLRAVQQVQIQLGLVKAGSPLPAVNDAPLNTALP
jgi:NitT/TauT family transport system substrate-binding protein